MSTYTENPEKDQNRAYDAYDHFEKFGYVMFKQNMKMYENIRDALNATDRITEAGCGNGLGTGILQQKCKNIIGTDKLDINVRFARSMYPWIEFDQWDIGKWVYEMNDVVVCVEALEHVKNYEYAIQNMINSARNTVWFTTPNRRTKNEDRPSNEFHVKEFLPEEVLDMIGGYLETYIYHWDTMEELDVNTDIDPLIYEVRIDSTV